MKENEETLWFDLRKDKDNQYYAVIGNTDGIAYVSKVADFNIEYDGYEFQVSETEKDYYISFWLNPEGGILPYSGEERSYDGLETDYVLLPKSRHTIDSALEYLTSNYEDDK